MSSNFLNTPIEYLKSVGPQKAELLKKELRIFNYSNLLTYYPFRYVDRTKFYKVKEINADLPYVQLRGKISHTEMVGAKRAQRFVATFTDETGRLELVWFQGAKWISEKIKPHVTNEYIIFGKPSVFNGKFNIAHPEIELVSEENTTFASALQAIYNSTDKLKTRSLDTKGISRLQKTLVALIKNNIPETLSNTIKERYQLISREEAIRQIHFPQNPEMLKKAEFRLKFEELFFIQLKLLKQKGLREKMFRGFVFSKVGDYFNTFYNNYLPFELTNAQKRVIKEIRLDMGSGKQMNRLLQGDVGSGKTLVALMNMLIAMDNGFQACLMAPTEILANQHYETISELLKPLSINVGLLTGSKKTKERRAIHEQLQNGEMQILIGTHALLEDVVQFKNIGFVVIDEQHRFGVAQRAKMWNKNSQSPHVLIMSATPIPRTLAMTLYGDLDVSVIDELPPGRKPIQTIHRFDNHRDRVFGFMREQIALDRQIYIVYPLIKESEKMDYKDLMDGYESIVRAFPQPKYQVSIVHGQLKSDVKEYEMQRFVKHQTHIMVATTVIEVGVNVPNASVMVIESAERFGLSQLHQLRGRVGRGAEQSYCILMTSHKLSSDGKLRMETMCRTNDGFEIADVDLKLRGPGDMAGTMQSGVLDLNIADLAKDSQILHAARNIVIELLSEDPNLEKSENATIAYHYSMMVSNKTNWSRIS
ncbi:MAG: ATP-dependent DNA helicase RecG [Bacteroidetes bacterium RIFCSPLOWO2_12_FULL_35_15]|nr:MAG: ATP-dependent DNA helicase RecG [Bacteroidetes bacterium RIFCSPLOWO2_12_FULL_35_15]